MMCGGLDDGDVEVDHQHYGWSGHEPAGFRAGLDQATIDAVKFNRDVAALPEKDATVIRLGRVSFAITKWSRHCG